MKIYIHKSPSKRTPEEMNNRPDGIFKIKGGKTVETGKYSYLYFSFLKGLQPSRRE